jgi:hypothetical protein
VISCSDYTDYFETVNKAPEVKLNGSGTILDTLKAGYSNTYLVTLEDEERLVTNFSQLAGDSVTISGDKLIVKAVGEGDNEILVRAKDSYGKESLAKLKLYRYRNLAPVAKLKIAGNESITLDASESFDGDSRFGGKITRYYFNINGFVIDDNLKRINYIFETTGVKSIKLMVQDNEGMWSNEIIINHIVN